MGNDLDYYDVSSQEQDDYFLTTEPSEPSGPLPIVMWHGMGDNCCHSFSMGAIKKMLEGHIPNVHVHSLMIGNSAEEDTLNGFFNGFHFDNIVCMYIVYINVQLK